MPLVESPAQTKIAAFGKLSRKLENYIRERKSLPFGDGDNELMAASEVSIIVVSK